MTHAFVIPLEAQAKLRIHTLFSTKLVKPQFNTFTGLISRACKKKKKKNWVIVHHVAFVQKMEDTFSIFITTVKGRSVKKNQALAIVTQLKVQLD